MKRAKRDYWFLAAWTLICALWFLGMMCLKVQNG